MRAWADRGDMDGSIFTSGVLYDQRMTKKRRLLSLLRPASKLPHDRPHYPQRRALLQSFFFFFFFLCCERAPATFRPNLFLGRWAGSWAVQMARSGHDRRHGRAGMCRTPGPSLLAVSDGELALAARLLSNGPLGALRSCAVPGGAPPGRGSSRAVRWFAPGDARPGARRGALFFCRS
ncbi:hypothetical protein BDY21DRAFT_49824 [Lineolata rhizophorae]|uniref:Uncharacterized protein n=1 Tax=Lineolata rhizophorae TaxID=578093 RepID=A0A6A6NY44_9PEZI|nr:hypothetical protein BDY21DRAFT_49824 [Lineolata rhizophorae]